MCKIRNAGRSEEEGACLGPQEGDQLVPVWAWLLILEFPKSGEPPNPGLTRAWSSLNKVCLLQSREGVVHKLSQKEFPLSVSGGYPPHTHLLGSKCPPPEERCLSTPETGERERNYLFKSYTNLE